MTCIAVILSHHWGLYQSGPWRICIPVVGAYAVPQKTKTSKFKDTLDFTLLDYYDTTREKLILAQHVPGPKCRWIMDNETGNILQWFQHKRWGQVQVMLQLEIKLTLFKLGGGGCTPPHFWNFQNHRVIFSNRALWKHFYFYFIQSLPY